MSVKKGFKFLLHCLVFTNTFAMQQQAYQNETAEWEEVGPSLFRNLQTGEYMVSNHNQATNTAPLYGGPYIQHPIPAQQQPRYGAHYHGGTNAEFAPRQMPAMNTAPHAHNQGSSYSTGNRIQTRITPTGHNTFRVGPVDTVVEQTADLIAQELQRLLDHLPPADDAQSFEELARICAGKVSFSRLIALMQQAKAQTDNDVLKSIIRESRIINIAIVANDVASIRQLANLGGGVNYITWDGLLSPLHIAVCSNLPHMVRELCEVGANCNALTDKGFTPLHYAAFFGFTTCAELVNRPVLLNKKIYDGWNALDLAILNHHPQTANYLRRHGAIESNSESSDFSDNYSSANSNYSQNAHYSSTPSTANTFTHRPNPRYVSDNTSVTSNASSNTSRSHASAYSSRPSAYESSASTESRGTGASSTTVEVVKTLAPVIKDVFDTLAKHFLH